MLPAGFMEVEIRRGRFCTLDAAGEHAQQGVVIIHASQLPAKQRRETVFRHAADDGLQLILVSGGHQDDLPLAAHIHRRRTPVRVRQVDAGFRDGFARFWNHLLDTGEMRWELLEPAREMLTVLALLCQGYLLAHVIPGTAQVALPGADDAENRLATEAMARLGLQANAPSLAAAAAHVGQAQVRDPSWWDALDPMRLKRALAAAAPASTAVATLAGTLTAGGAPHGACVLHAYLEIETSLRR